MEQSLESKALGILEQALKQFTGALIVVSHDEVFLQALDIDQRYSLHQGGLYQT